MMDPVAFQTHDHTRCIRTGVATVDAKCREAGLQLTPIRRRVLEILLEGHRALGAYEILDVLSSEGYSAQPPVAYRALDFLVTHGFAHRIERLNAFIACTHPERSHTPAFLICKDCSKVAEANFDAALGTLGLAVRDAGFLLQRTIVEAEGICPNCQAAKTP